ncbi:MAG: phage integrase SAM-like domain-containing protein [Bacteroidetes bacterium]|nr:phage integrase SAM-like domain-containing protein [Bacteroidota bacterium]
MQIYKATINKLIEFSKAKKCKIDFEHITLNFIMNLPATLTQQGMATNTVGKYIKTINHLLNEATNEEHNNLGI